MSEYTTTRQDVKFKFTEYGYLTDNPDHDDRAESLRFDRWLAEHDAALIEGLADEIRHKQHAESIRQMLLGKARQRREREAGLK